jgi:hypothetical protein
MLKLNHEMFMLNQILVCESNEIKFNSEVPQITVFCEPSLHGTNVIGAHAYTYIGPKPLLAEIEIQLFQNVGKYSISMCFYITYNLFFHVPNKANIKFAVPIN